MISPKVLLKAAFIVALFGISMIPNTTAEDPDPYETDVAITNVDIIDDEFHNNKYEYEILAPTYHDLFVDSENYQVTFNNYVSFSDLRTIYNEYHLIIKIVVHEIYNGEKYLVKEKTTFNEYYNPPFNMSSIDTIFIDVDIQGAISHIYDVSSVYSRWRVEDNEEILLDNLPLGQNATVHEMEENPLTQEPTA